jgi:hypothetical protein
MGPLARPPRLPTRGFQVLATFSQIGPKYLVEEVVEEVFAQASIVLLEFLKEIFDALGLLCRVVPKFIRGKIEEIKGFAMDLLSEPNAASNLLTELLESS